VREVGTCMIGQTARLAPADRRIYALRDVTGTVECVPLIVASILSKKLAEGIDGLCARRQSRTRSVHEGCRGGAELARALVRVGNACRQTRRALLTDMNVPIGTTIGNALETARPSRS